MTRPIVEQGIPTAEVASSNATEVRGTIRIKFARTALSLVIAASPAACGPDGGKNDPSDPTHKHLRVTIVGVDAIDMPQLTERTVGIEPLLEASNVLVVDKVTLVEAPQEVDAIFAAEVAASGCINENNAPSTVRREIGLPETENLVVLVPETLCGGMGGNATRWGNNAVVTTVYADGKPIAPDDVAAAAAHELGHSFAGHEDLIECGQQTWTGETFGIDEQGRTTRVVDVVAYLNACKQFRAYRPGKVMGEPYSIDLSSPGAAAYTPMDREWFRSSLVEEDLTETRTHAANDAAVELTVADAANEEFAVAQTPLITVGMKDATSGKDVALSYDGIVVVPSYEQPEDSAGGQVTRTLGEIYLMDGQLRTYAYFGESGVYEREVFIVGNVAVEVINASGQPVRVSVIPAPNIGLGPFPTLS
jgi:hypothetical protein